MDNKERELLLIDGHSILFRAFYGISLTMTAPDGMHTNAVYGFFNILKKMLEEEQPEYLAVAFDLPSATFRHELYPDYKGNRGPSPDEFREQVPVVKEILREMQIPVVTAEGFEADDVLGTLSRQAAERGITTVIVSGDRDLLQISGPATEIIIPKTRGGETTYERYRPDDVKAAFGVTPEGFIELKALMGDSSDNVPGLPGVGPKTAQKILEQFGSIREARLHADEIKPKKAMEAMRDHGDELDLSLRLVTIRTDAPVTFDEEEFRLGNIYTPEAGAHFKRLGMKSFLDRFEETADTGTQTNECKKVTDPDECRRIFEEAAAAPEAGLSLLGEQSFAAGAEGRVLLYALSVAYRGLVYTFVPSETLTEEFLISCVRKLMEQGQRVAVMDAKQLLKMVPVKDEGRLFDCVIAAYLLDPLKSDWAYDTVSTAYAGKTVPAEEELVGKKGLKAFYDSIRDFRLIPKAGQAEADTDGTDSTEAYIAGADKTEANTAGEDETEANTAGAGKAVAAKTATPEAAEEYLQKIQILERLAALQSETALLAVRPLTEKLEETNMLRLFDEVEMPLTYVLSSMENTGILASREELAKYGASLSARIDELTEDIYEQADEEFNINSPKQLGHILFDVMHMPGGKKTKTGYSTAADVLEKLAPEYPIVAEILEYRTLTKLKSTYADGLAAFIDEDGRIRTSFKQTVTATGRLSSADPNLQNIPMREELGRLIRKCFYPKEGCLFVDADYSQIELRILAHMSGDDKLIEAYRQSEDIHRITASQVFHVPLEEVTDQMRRNAKAVNFGIVYGISSFGLSQGLSISRQEAQEYINSYFETYPKIREFLEGLVSSAKKNGYAVSLFGRRRPIPELKSSNFMQRSFGERAAMNSPIQGTAADIMKIAMKRVYNRLMKEVPEASLILQIHDELLVEVPEQLAGRAREIVSEEMEGVAASASLKVDLITDSHVGTDWYDAK